jgi:glutamate N-acetyltransferase / amino-acid N-acetyltransferase
MKEIRGGITAPMGFRANGIACGIKKSNKRDLALLVSDSLCDAVAVFTTNRVKASCVNFNLGQLKNNRTQALIVNSGNANCLTGQRGMRDTVKMAAMTSRLTGIPKGNVLVASTGVIGEPLPIKKICAAIPPLVKGLKQNRQVSRHAAQAIMTTDRQIKEIAVQIEIDGKKVRLGAMAKGAGMIHPHMTLNGKGHATMLCFVTTDARIDPRALKKALVEATHKTFNMITVDSDQSTNDMVIIASNGRAKNKIIRTGSFAYRKFYLALEHIFLKMAQAIVWDAEGATKFVTLNVRNASSLNDARSLAIMTASSSLVKTAFFGCDPNWGRIAARVGASSHGTAASGHAEAKVDPKRLTLKLGNVTVLRRGAPCSPAQSSLNRLFRKKRINITVDLGLGRYHATAWTCDLSLGYVKINANYRT